MKNSITEFLDEKQIADPMRSAFIAYCKSLYSSRYLFKENGDTIKIFIDRMTRDQVDAAWQEFIGDLRNILPKTLV